MNVKININGADVPESHIAINRSGIPRLIGARKMKTRNWCLKFHAWIALFVGFLFVVLGLTGSINVFRWEIDALLNPSVKATKEYGETRSLDEIVRAAMEVLPNCKGKWSLQLASNVSPMALVRCRETRSEHWFSLQMIWVNPYTAEVVSSRTFGKFFATWVYDLHWALLMGKTGHILVGILGLFLMTSLMTGLYLWWPSLRGLGKALTIKRKASSERKIFDLHKTFGFYALPILFGLAFTGTYLVFPEYIKPLVNQFSSATPGSQNMVSVPISGQMPIGVDKAAEVAKQVFSDGELKWIDLPNGPQGVYEVSLRRDKGGVSELLNKTYGGSRVVIDQYSGQILAVHDSENLTFGELFFDVQWPFHSGEALGLPGRILWCAVGFVPLILYVTGLIRWFQKRQASRKSLARKNLRSYPIINNE